MYQELATLDDATEETYALEFEEAALITLGLCYLENGRFSGGAYHPILRRSDQFIKKPLHSALDVRRERAKTLMDLDKTVVEKVEALKSKGFTSPYLKSFVVARINPIRFRPKDAAPLSFDEVMYRISNAAEKINSENTQKKYLVGVVHPPNRPEAGQELNLDTLIPAKIKFVSLTMNFPRG